MTSYMIRMKPEERRENIIEAATRLTILTGGYDWTKQNVADECDLPCGVDTVKHYFTKRGLVKIVKARINPKTPT